MNALQPPLPPLARSNAARAQLFAKIQASHEKAQALRKAADDMRRSDEKKADRLQAEAWTAEDSAAELLLGFPEVRYWPWRDEQQKKSDLLSIVREIVRP